MQILELLTELMSEPNVLSEFRITNLMKQINWDVLKASFQTVNIMNASNYRPNSN